MCCLYVSESCEELSFKGWEFVHFQWYEPCRTNCFCLLILLYQKLLAELPPAKHVRSWLMLGTVLFFLNLVEQERQIVMT